MPLAQSTLVIDAEIISQNMLGSTLAQAEKGGISERGKKNFLEVN